MLAAERAERRRLLLPPVELLMASRPLCYLPVLYDSRRQVPRRRAADNCYHSFIRDAQRRRFAQFDLFAGRLASL